MTALTPEHAARATLNALLDEIFGEIERITWKPGCIDRETLDGWRTDTAHLLAAIAAREPQPAPGDAQPELAELRAENTQLRGWLLGIMRGNDAEINAARMQADEWIVEEGL